LCEELDFSLDSNEALLDVMQFNAKGFFYDRSASRGRVNAGSIANRAGFLISGPGRRTSELLCNRPLASLKAIHAIASPVASKAAVTAKVEARAFLTKAAKAGMEETEKIVEGEVVESSGKTGRAILVKKEEVAAIIRGSCRTTVFFKSLDSFRQLRHQSSLFVGFLMRRKSPKIPRRLLNQCQSGAW
jgi:hypothetical protein